MSHIDKDVWKTALPEEAPSSGEFLDGDLVIRRANEFLSAGIQCVFGD